MSKQLERVAQWEREKEEQAARNLKLAQQQLQMEQQKLQGLESYKIDYLKQIQQVASQGIKAQSLNQHHSFIGKLDKACEQQTQLLRNADNIVKQRRQQWLKQQGKRKAVEHLLQKHASQLQQKQNKAEQAMMDEFALQRFLRAKGNSAF